MMMIMIMKMIMIMIMILIMIMITIIILIIVIMIIISLPGQLEAAKLQADWPAASGPRPDPGPAVMPQLSTRTAH